MAKVEHMNGKTGVRIEDDRYGDISILMTRNGYQWSGGTGNRELLVMLRKAIDEFLGPTLETEVRCTCKDFPGADEFCTAHKAPRTPVEQPNDAFRWICVHCTTVNSNLVITCDSCARERYPRLNRRTE